MNIDSKLSDWDMDILHDIVYEATGKDYSNEALNEMLGKLPTDFKMEIVEWGVSDTLTRELLYDYFEEETNV